MLREGERTVESGGVHDVAIEASGGQARATIDIRLFGSLRVSTPSVRLTGRDFPSRKASQLCAVLAVASGSPVSKDRLIELLWGQRLPMNPGATVEHTVSTLRAALRHESEPSAIVTAAGGYRFDLSRVRIDVVEFDRLVEAAARTGGLEALHLLQAALRLVDGELVEDETSTSWVVATRGRYHRRVERALLDAARLALAHDQPELARSLAARAGGNAPLPNAEAGAATAAALAQLGRRHDALVVLDELERELVAAYGVGLSPEAETLRCVLRAPPSRVPPAVSVKVNISIGPAVDELSFVGRETELAIIDQAIDRAVDGATQLVLIEGAAGMGKSRLLAEVAARRLDIAVMSLGCSPADRPFPLLLAARLFRALARTSSRQLDPAAGDSAAAMFAGIAGLIDDEGPLAVLLDDIHCADTASIAVLNALACTAATHALAIVATRRPDRAAAADRVAQPNQTIVLGPLAADDLARLGLADASVETGGHPATVMACIAAASTDGLLRSAALRAVVDRVAEAGEPASRLLRVAAALDQPFTATDLAFAARLAPGMVLDVLERAFGVGLVASAGDRFGFTDDLTRRVLLAVDPG